MQQKGKFEHSVVVSRCEADGLLEHVPSPFRLADLQVRVRQLLADRRLPGGLLDGVLEVQNGRLVVLDQQSAIRLGKRLSASAIVFPGCIPGSPPQFLERPPSGGPKRGVLGLRGSREPCLGSWAIPGALVGIGQVESRPGVSRLIGQHLLEDLLCRAILTDAQVRVPQLPPCDRRGGLPFGGWAEPIDSPARVALAERSVTLF